MPATTDRFYLPVTLNGRGYMVDLAKYKRATLPVHRSGQDPSREPSEQSLTTEGHWRRHGQDWANGAGQLVYDEQLLFGAPIDRNSNRSQFRTSKGVDVWTKHQLTLLPDTTSIRTMVGTGSQQMLTTPDGQYLYSSDGKNLCWTLNPISGPSFHTFALQHNDFGQDITSDGSTIYIAMTANPIQSSTIGSTASADFGAFDASRICYSNGRLIATAGQRVVEVDAAGAVGGAGQLDYTRTGPSWDGITSAPNGIYVRSQQDCYLITENDQTGGLNVPINVLTMPTGELLYNMLFYGGMFVLATSRGIRLAVVSSNGALVYGPVILINNDNSQTGVHRLAASGEFVWFDWQNYDSGSTGLGRLDLAHFTEPLVASYATDLMVTRNGTGFILGLTVVNGQPFFNMSDNSGTKMWTASTSKVSSGTIYSGKVRFGTFEDKVLRSLDVRHDPLPSGASVAMHVTLEDGTDITAGTSSTTGSFGPVNEAVILNSGSQPKGEECEVVITLNRATDTTTGPTLHRWTLDATVAPARQEQWILPLIWRHEVENPFGIDITYDDLRAEFDLLKTLESAGTVFPMTEGDQSYSVKIEEIEVDPEKWDDNMKFFEGLVYVTVTSEAAGT